ncbi:MAG: shikimate dehydrogenase [Desulfobacterales bacterium]|nr:shikimate dehydrogenase [Desulfobacterales bacterium]
MKINASTSLFCVIGDPVSHSLSPIMHNAAFEHLNINAVYLAFNVKNVDSAISGIRDLGIKGTSVTIPHKVKVMNFLDKIDDTALKIGAVNTIVNQDGKLLGFNTDCLGAVKALMNKTPIKNKKVVLLGAGGAARAIGFGILNEGGNLSILNILEDEGQSLAKSLGVNYYHLSEYKKVDYEILINTTPVGMFPDVDKSPIPKDGIIKGSVIMDIIYNPLKTKLLHDAEAEGCLTIDGTNMFVYQGAIQFEMWTHQKAPIDIMKKTVIEELSALRCK